MRYSKIIFDLDDTLIPTHANPQWKEGDYTNLYFSKSVVEMLEKVGREHAILLTFDKYGDQKRKLDHLQVEKYFEKVIVVEEKFKKKDWLENLKNEFGNILVIGDRYDEGELYHAESLEVDTVCVAFLNGTHRKPEHHHKHLLIIENDDEYQKIFNILIFS